jgi:hypothetical protein
LSKWVLSGQNGRDEVVAKPFSCLARDMSSSVLAIPVMIAA